MMRGESVGGVAVFAISALDADVAAFVEERFIDFLKAASDGGEVGSHVAPIGHAIRDFVGEFDEGDLQHARELVSLIAGHLHIGAIVEGLIIVVVVFEHYDEIAGRVETEVEFLYNVYFIVGAHEPGDAEELWKNVLIFHIFTVIKLYLQIH